MDFPVLPKDVLRLNEQLRDAYGIDTESTQPMWRVSWSNDQYENRLTKYTPEGLEMLHEEVKQLPKYQWVKDRWILEQLVAVPEVNQRELAGAKQSYECMFVFEDRFKNATKPMFRAAKFVIDTVRAAMGKSSMAKYVEEKDTAVAKKERVDKLVEELFGDESDLMMRTVTGEAIIVPRNYEKSGES